MIDRRVCVKGVVIEEDGVKKMHILSSDAVALGRHVLDLCSVISTSVCKTVLLSSFSR